MTNHSGLTLKEVKERQEKYGKNEITAKNKGKLFKIIRTIISEPIYLLLTFAAIIYYILGEPTDGAIMIVFVLFVIGIDVFQEIRTGNALRKLKDITTPRIRVIREGKETLVPAIDLVPGEYMIISEGVKIPADGYLLTASGLCIDESILTGETLGVWKSARENNQNSQLTQNKSKKVIHLKPTSSEEYFRRDYCYTGTFVILGYGIVIVENTGNHTEYGRIVDSISKTPMTHSLLQTQMRRLVKQCTLIAVILFIMVSLVTFLNISEYVLAKRIIHSILAGIVLALSMIPAEFPVILSVFLSMGALRLSKKKALIRHLPAVETLGAVSVLCMDKTGTITQNKMQVSDCFIMDRFEGRFCKIMALACKLGTYDPVEEAMLEYGEQLCRECNSQQEVVMACNMKHSRPALIQEYAFTNELKAMAQVWQDSGKTIIAAKGCPETILSLCNLSKEQTLEVNQKITAFLEKGLRVLAIADRTLLDTDCIPDTLAECHLFLRGIVGLLDPPREEIIDNIKTCYTAGIRVVMITGDHPITASSIARIVGIKNYGQIVTGDELSDLTDEELKDRVKNCNLFARVLPLHKMRIVKALQENGEIVAMTGDGVNDSPAQKIADIGIAMGMHGSEVCREAADLILLDDNFSTILESVKDGRRIYQNIIKTVGYVFAIHIPIAFISLAAPILGIEPGALMLLPLHIVLLELVMDPTCSVVLERQPAECDIMREPPRRSSELLLSTRRLFKSILQGLIIFAFSFGSYFVLLSQSLPIAIARTTGFAVLVFANVFLVLINCSETESTLRTIKKIGKDRGIWLVNFIILFGFLLLIYSPLHETLGFAPLTAFYLTLAISLSALSVLWYELVKLVKKSRIKKARLNSY